MRLNRHGLSWASRHQEAIVGKPNIRGPSGRKRAGVGSATRAKPVLSEAASRDVCSPRDQCPHAGMSRPASAASEPRRSLGEQGPGGPPGGKRTIPEGRANLARLAARRGGFQMLWWPLSRRGLSRNRGGLLAAANGGTQESHGAFPYRARSKTAPFNQTHRQARQAQDRAFQSRPKGSRVDPADVE